MLVVRLDVIRGSGIQRYRVVPSSTEYPYYIMGLFGAAATPNHVFCCCSPVPGTWLVVPIEAACQLSNFMEHCSSSPNLTRHTVFAQQYTPRTNTMLEEYSTNEMFGQQQNMTCDNSCTWYSSSTDCISTTYLEEGMKASAATAIAINAKAVFILPSPSPSPPPSPVVVTARHEPQQQHHHHHQQHHTTTTVTAAIAQGG